MSLIRSAVRIGTNLSDIAASLLAHDAKSLGDPDDLPLLTRLAARMEPAMRREFLAAVRGAAGVIDIGGLAEAVQSGQVTQIEAAAQLAKLSADLQAKLLPVLGRTFSLGIAVGAEAAGVPPGISFGFDLVNPQSITWVREHAAELVTEVTDSTRLGIRSLVEIAFREGRAPRELARDIREVIGLHSRQVTAVQNFRARLADEGIAQETIDRRADRYAQAQLRSRAQTIARTETLTASNQGQLEVWGAARAQGYLDPATTKRKWLTTPDDLLDTEICERMTDVETGLNEPWTLPDGRSVMIPTKSHPRCRCSAGLTFA